MQYTRLGRSGIKVSVVGLGTGGASRLGRARGRTLKDAVNLVHAALDFGINFIDTAWAYGTEDVVGQALRGRREGVVLATKTFVVEDPAARSGSRLISPQDLRERVNDSLRRLGTDYIDIYQLQSVTPDRYDAMVETAVPVLERLRAEGKLRYLGLTEHFNADRTHSMLRRALQDDVWDVVMLGFNLLNPSARVSVLPLARSKNVGAVAMFAVRGVLTSFERLQEAMRAALAAGVIDRSDTVALGDTPFAYLIDEHGAESLVEAAYRFCRHEPGIDVVLTGTGDVAHLRSNVDALLKPPLPLEALRRLEPLGARLAAISGD